MISFDIPHAPPSAPRSCSDPTCSAHSFLNPRWFFDTGVECDTQTAIETQAACETKRKRRREIEDKSTNVALHEDLRLDYNWHKDIKSLPQRRRRASSSGSSHNGCTSGSSISGGRGEKVLTLFLPEPGTWGADCWEKLVKKDSLLMDTEPEVDSKKCSPWFKNAALSKEDEAYAELQQHVDFDIWGPKIAEQINSIEAMEAQVWPHRPSHRPAATHFRTRLAALRSDASLAAEAISCWMKCVEGPGIHADSIVDEIGVARMMLTRQLRERETWVFTRHMWGYADWLREEMRLEEYDSECWIMRRNVWKYMRRAQTRIGPLGAEHHIESSLRGRVWGCKACKKLFPSREQAILHVSRRHRGLI